MSKQQDIVIGTAGSGRGHDDLKNIMGYFVNTVILRNQIDWDEKFIDILNAINTNTINALQYQYYPLELMVEELNVDYPHIPVFFNMINMGESQNMTLEDMRSYHIEEVPTVKFDLVFYLKEFENGIVIGIHYDGNKIDPETIEEISNEYVTLLEKLSENPNTSLNDLRQKKKKKKFGKK